jgi:hypothetical protein
MMDLQRPVWYVVRLGLAWVAAAEIGGVGAGWGVSAAG